MSTWLTILNKNYKFKARMKNLECYYFNKACLTPVSYIPFFFYMNNISTSLSFYLANNPVDSQILS